jgi:hypothetical protein
MAAAKKEWKWWYYVASGLLIIAVSVWEFLDLSKLEQEGGSRMVSSYIALLYNLLGKWGILVVGLLLGVFGIAFGIWTLQKNKAR